MIIIYKTVYIYNKIILKSQLRIYMMIKNKIKVKWLKSKNDIKFNIEKFQKESNILFITGLVGSGKSTLARKLGEEYMQLLLYKTI